MERSLYYCCLHVKHHPINIHEYNKEKTAVPREMVTAEIEVNIFAQTL